MMRGTDLNCKAFLVEGFVSCLTVNFFDAIFKLDVFTVIHTVSDKDRQNSQLYINNCYECSFAAGVKLYVHVQCT